MPDRKRHPDELAETCQVVQTLMAGHPVHQFHVRLIFDQFLTTKPLGEGTGPGLSMVHGFARLSGEQVTMRSEVGRVTTCIFLPRFLGEIGAEVEITASEAAAPRAGESVVLIEDEPTILFLVAEVLQDAGYRVIAADDGSAGLAILVEGHQVDPAGNTRRLAGRTERTASCRRREGLSTGSNGHVYYPLRSKRSCRQWVN